METPLPLMTEVSSSSQPLGTAVLGRVFVVVVVVVVVSAGGDCAAVAEGASPSLARDSKGPDVVGAGIQLQKEANILYLRCFCPFLAIFRRILRLYFQEFLLILILRKHCHKYRITDKRRRVNLQCIAFVE